MPPSTTFVSSRLRLTITDTRPGTSLRRESMSAWVSGNFPDVQTRQTWISPCSLSLAYVKVPEDPFSCRFVVDRQPCMFGPSAHDVYNGTKYLGLQEAVVLLHHPVAARRIKADHRPVRPRHDRILRLVAVTAVALAADDRQNLRVQPAYTGQGVGDPLLLVPQLRLIGNMPPGAAAAAAEGRTAFLRRQTIAGGDQKFLHPSVSQPFFHFEDPAPDPVPDCGERHDHRHTAAFVTGLGTADAAALRRGPCNNERDNLIFDKPISVPSVFFFTNCTRECKKYKEKAGKDESSPAFSISSRIL